MVTRCNDNRVEGLDTKEGICTVQKYECNDFVDFGDFNCTAFISKNSDDIKLFELKDNTNGISVGNRVIFNRIIYDIQEKEDNVLKVIKNDFESSLLKFQDMGVSIERGIRVPVGKTLSPENDYYVDQWVAKWTRNIAKNYELILNGKSIQDLKDTCKDVPIVIVGAGPSLDKNIDELKGINAVIIATDRAYKPLLARGIEPDLVVSVDCHDDLILEYLNKVDSTNHTLILNSSADYQIARNWKGEILYFNMNHNGMQFCDRVLPYMFPNFMAVANAGCVVNTGVIIAGWLGCDTLILAGCDFSYPDKKMSCDTYDLVDNKFVKIEVDEEERFNKRSCKVLKNDIYTYPPFIDYAKTMEVLSKQQKINIINATEGGILDKFTLMTLKEAKEKYCNKDVSSYKMKLKKEK